MITVVTRRPEAIQLYLCVVTPHTSTHTITHILRKTPCFLPHPSTSVSTVHVAVPVEGLGRCKYSPCCACEFDPEPVRAPELIADPNAILLSSPRCRCSTECLKDVRTERLGSSHGDVCSPQGRGSGPCSADPRIQLQIHRNTLGMTDSPECNTKRDGLCWHASSALCRC